ncbi:MAG: acyl-CoA desaturase [Xenococcaceae cyanobacterium]
MKTITIKSDRLKRQQEIHGITNIILPFLGTIAAVVVAFQVGVSAADIWLFVIMYFLTMIGITVGFHRHFAHCTFEANQAVRVILAILGSMAAQGPLNYWVATHRRHHKYSDADGDPHSPYVKEDKRFDFLEGLWHSHMGWTFNHELTNTFIFAKDIVREPIMTRISQLYYFWIFLGVAIPALGGGLISGTWMGALTGFLWGGCVRIFLQHHIGFWTIGSVAHLYGTSPFETGDHSRNNIWLAIPTGGEMWHNNHHAFPNTAIFGFEWWQIDIGGWVIRALEKVGLVWELKIPTTAMIEAKKNKADSAKALG